MVSSRGITKRKTKYLDNFSSSENCNIKFHFDQVNNVPIIWIFCVTSKTKMHILVGQNFKLPAIVESAKKKEPHQHIRDNFWHKLDHFCFPSLCIISEQTRDEFKVELEIVQKEFSKMSGSLHQSMTRNQMRISGEKF